MCKAQMLAVLIIVLVTFLGVLGLSIYLAVEVKKLKDEVSKSETQYTELKDADLTMKSQVDADMDGMYQRILQNQLTLNSNQTFLRYHSDNPFSRTSNLMTLKLSGSNITDPALVTTSNSSNVSLELLSRVSLISGLNINELDKAAPVKFCFKSTGQCMTVPDSNNDFTINSPNNLNMAASNIWMDAPVAISSNRQLNFRSVAGGSNLASLSMAGNNISIVPGVTTPKIELKTAGATTPYLTIETAPTGEAVISSPTNKIRLQGDVTVTGSLNSSSTVTSIPVPLP